jgi:glucokinase
VLYLSYRKQETRHSASAGTDVTLEETNHTGDSTLLRRVNKSAVLELIRCQGPITRTDIAQHLHLSLPTITRIVSDLIENGYVSERNGGDSRGGRRPSLLQFNFRAGLIIGVYVQQKMVAALADLGGEILARRMLPALRQEAGIAQLIVLIEGLRQEAAALGIPVRGVGVGAPSIVNFRDGTVAWAPYLGWRNLPLKRRLEEALGLPVFVENEVNLIALGERWFGAGRGKCQLICVSLGAGVGAGLILNGQLYRGARDASGEIGYLVHDRTCLDASYDDGFGCLESLAGSNGMVRRAMARLAAGEASVLANGNDLTAEAVLLAARAGDSVACKVVDETVDYVSIALINLACILDPELIVISGELAEFGDLFVDQIRQRLRGVIPVVPEIVLSELRMDAAMLGAVDIVLRETSGAIFVQPTRA